MTSSGSGLPQGVSGRGREETRFTEAHARQNINTIIRFMRTV